MMIVPKLTIEQLNAGDAFQFIDTEYWGDSVWICTDTEEGGDRIVVSFKKGTLWHAAPDTLVTRKEVYLATY